MADNWSASPLTLAGVGDWCEWTFNIPDATAANVLNAAGDSIGIRGALPGPALTAELLVQVNGAWFRNMDPSIGSSDVGPTSGSSDGSWVSADRFQFIGSSLLSGFGSINVGPPGAAGPVVGGVTAFPLAFTVTSPGVDSPDVGLPDPFVVGTNTIRIINFTGQSVEVDFLYIATGAHPGVPVFGNDFTSETAPTGFAGHVDPVPSVQTSMDREWILLPSDASVGSSALAILTPKKFCPRIGSGVNFTTKVVLSDTGGTPIVGAEVWLWDSSLVALSSAITDGDGVAELDLLAGDGGYFFYLGSHDWSPCSMSVVADERINCGGWHVGNVGTG